MDKNSFYAIGLMSGTSLDGLDIVYSYFLEKDESWLFEIFASKTVPYSNEIKEKLKNSHNLDGKALLEFHNEYGEWIGKQVRIFIEENKIGSVDFIASHGHTVFHDPAQRFNFQIGNPYFILKETGIPVVADFRSRNIVFGGQGAPLVPVGDKLLFSNYKYRINIGGFANISYEDKNGETMAYDICPANFVINSLVEPLGLEMDKDGQLASRGKVISALLDDLNKISFYEQQPPKSLSREWLDENFYYILAEYKSVSTYDMLATVYEHIAVQIATAVKEDGDVLLTGGGAKNKFLVERIKSKLQGNKVVVPSEKIIDYKESLIFAFLGVLSYCKKNNCLASYTGAPEDMNCGVWYF